MIYHTWCVFTVVFTVVFTACSLCVHCVFIANEFWAPSSSSLCRGRRPSSSFVRRSVDPCVGRPRRPSLVVHRRRCRPSVGSSARSTCPCLSRQTRVSSPLTYGVANHTNFLPAFFSRLSSHRSPRRFFLRIATLHSKPAAQRAPADPRKSRLDFPI